MRDGEDWGERIELPLGKVSKTASTMFLREVKRRLATTLKRVIVPPARSERSASCRSGARGGERAERVETLASERTPASRVSRLAVSEHVVQVRRTRRRASGASRDARQQANAREPGIPARSERPASRRSGAHGGERAASESRRSPASERPRAGYPGSQEPTRRAGPAHTAASERSESRRSPASERPRAGYPGSQ